MAEKNIKARIVHKHDVEANWKLATGFIPMAGEIIIYDIDTNYDYERIKIGDGVKNVNELPFYAGNWNDIMDKPFTPVIKALVEREMTVGAGTTLLSVVGPCGYTSGRKLVFHDNAILTIRIGEEEWQLDKATLDKIPVDIGQYNGATVSIKKSINSLKRYNISCYISTALSEDVDVYMSYGLLFDVINEDNLPVILDEEFLAWLNEENIVSPVATASGKLYVTNNNEVYVL